MFEAGGWAERSQGGSPAAHLPYPNAALAAAPQAPSPLPGTRFRGSPMNSVSNRAQPLRTVLSPRHSERSSPDSRKSSDSRQGGVGLQQRPATDRDSGPGPWNLDRRGTGHAVHRGSRRGRDHPSSRSCSGAERLSPPAACGGAAPPQVRGAVQGTVSPPASRRWGRHHTKFAELLRGRPRLPGWARRLRPAGSPFFLDDFGDFTLDAGARHP